MLIKGSLSFHTKTLPENFTRRQLFSFISFDWMDDLLIPRHFTVKFVRVFIFHSSTFEDQLAIFTTFDGQMSVSGKWKRARKMGWNQEVVYWIEWLETECISETTKNSCRAVLIELLSHIVCYVWNKFFRARKKNRTKNTGCFFFVWRKLFQPRQFFQMQIQNQINWNWVEWMAKTCFSHIKIRVFLRSIQFNSS